MCLQCVCMNKVYAHRGDACVCACVRVNKVYSHVISAMLCLCVCVCLSNVYAQGNFFKAMRVCAYVYACTRRYVPCDCCKAVHVPICMHKAYAHSDCCEAMRVCACLCVHMNEAYAHGDRCKAMSCMCRSVCSSTNSLLSVCIKVCSV